MGKRGEVTRTVAPGRWNGEERRGNTNRSNGHVADDFDVRQPSVETDRLRDVRTKHLSASTPIRHQFHSTISRGMEYLNCFVEERAVGHGDADRCADWLRRVADWQKNIGIAVRRGLVLQICLSEIDCLSKGVVGERLGQVGHGVEDNLEVLIFQGAIRGLHRFVRGGVVRGVNARGGNEVH
jgi:hypothetical protein